MRCSLVPELPYLFLLAITEYLVTLEHQIVEPGKIVYKPPDHVMQGAFGLVEWANPDTV